MFVEFGIGDAVGAGHEFANPTRTDKLNNLGYVSHPKHKSIPPGTYTDDTQMAIAIAELLLSDKPWTLMNVADALVEQFRRDPRSGYARSFQKVLEDMVDGIDFLKVITPQSDRNGATVRAVAAGMLPDFEQMMDFAITQATVTHATRGGIDGAVGAAALIHYFYYDKGEKRRVGNFCSWFAPSYPWIKEWDPRKFPKGVPCHGPSTVHAAIHCLVESSSLSEVLVRAIGLYGDTDSVASLALAAGSLSWEIVNDLPAHLVKDFENGPYGLDYLAGLDQRLMAKYPRSAKAWSAQEVGHREALSEKRSAVWNHNNKPTHVIPLPTEDGPTALEEMFADDDEM